MSLQTILLNTDTKQQGLYDAQLHSCQVYKTPVLPSDVIREQDIAPIPVQPFIRLIYMPNLTPTLPFLTFTTESIYILTGNFPVTDYVCVGIGFSNSENENVRGFGPVTENGYCAISYHRSSSVGSPLGTDNIWAWVIPRTSFSYINPSFMPT